MSSNELQRPALLKGYKKKSCLPDSTSASIIFETVLINADFRYMWKKKEKSNVHINWMNVHKLCYGHMLEKTTRTLDPEERGCQILAPPLLAMWAGHLCALNLCLHL